MSESIKNAFAIVASLYMAFLLTTIPMPESINFFRPSWVALVIIFWCLYFPAVFGVLSGLCAGLVFDVLVGSPLGLQGLTFSVVAFITLIMQKRLRFFNLWQQVGVVFVITGVERLLSYWLSVLVADVSGFSLWSALSSALLWLPINAVMISFLRMCSIRGI